MNWKVAKAVDPLKGALTVPPDKSISHRAIMFSSISDGRCRISNFLMGEDCLSTLEAFRDMGVNINIDGNNVIVDGKGMKGLERPPEELYLGNSGTTMRVLAGILAGQDFDAVLTGDSSLSKRPMTRIIKPLGLMGADLEPLEGGDHAPLKIKGGACLKAIDYMLPVASAQVKSCVLLAGLYAEGKTSVAEPFQSRDHTERMLKYFGAEIEREGLVTRVKGPGKLCSRDIFVPGDISSAAFFLVAAVMVEGSSLVIKDVGLNETRTGVVNVLKRMGADISIKNVRDEMEPVGDIEVKYGPLEAVTVEEDEIPLLIDEVPVLAVAAARARGTTVIKGIKELKVKETDRVKTIIDNLTAMGADVREENEALVIEGGRGELKSSVLNSYGDHRIAMSMAVAALASDGECEIADTECAATSYPGFMDDLESLYGKTDI